MLRFRKRAIWPAGRCLMLVLAVVLAGITCCAGNGSIGWAAEMAGTFSGEEATAETPGEPSGESLREEDTGTGTQESGATEDGPQAEPEEESTEGAGSGSREEPSGGTPEGTEGESPEGSEEESTEGTEGESSEVPEEESRESGEAESESDKETEKETEKNSEEEPEKESEKETEKTEPETDAAQDPLAGLEIVRNIKLKSTASRTMKVTWKKQKAADGYEVGYSPDPSMKRQKTIILSGNDRTSVTIRHLDVHSICYVTVRALRLTGGSWVRGPLGKILSKEVKGKLVVIDPGHQAMGDFGLEPIGPGETRKKTKVTTGTQGVVTKKAESELNLEVALKLRDALEKEGYQVRLTREKEKVNLSNVDRARMANEWKADAYIRIHADSTDSAYSNGTMTICPTKYSPYPIRKLYKKCYLLSKYVLEGVCKSTGAQNRGVYTSDEYSGMNWAEVPVTILEMGFMSNPREDRLMATDSYQNKIVAGIVSGVNRFFKKK